MTVMVQTPLSPIILQRRLTELGRIRIGEKGSRGEPKQLGTFRITSASERLLVQVAEVYGGTVAPWKDAPDEGYFQLTTTTNELDILIPPTLSSYSQAMELWDRGGCVRRCDGVTEKLSGGPCLCNPDKRDCQVTTRVSVMLPRVPGLGVWRLDTKGWNAAATLPTTLETLGALAPGQWVPAVLRIEKRSAKRKVDGKPQTRRFVVPVIDIVGGTIGQALEGGLSALPAPLLDAGPSRREKVARPALPAGPPPPERAQLSPGANGERTRVRTVESTTSGAVTPAGEEQPVSPTAPSPAHATAEPPPLGEAAATVLNRCEGFDIDRGRCVRDPGHDGNHQNHEKESWK